MNDLLVMKFGGTSVGSAERMRVAAEKGYRLFFLGATPEANARAEGLDRRGKCPGGP